MAIEKEFKFNDEADFVARFLDALLRRLGFSVVIPYHGKREFGRDLIFAEIDRFRQVAYHALQGKYVDAIHQGDSKGLIDDCEEAFRHPFTNPTTGEQHYITTFVIANGGSFTDNARENFFVATTHAERIGQVRLLDGRTLLSLDRWASFGTVQQVGEILSGLLIEVRYNRQMGMFISGELGKYIKDEQHPIPSWRLRKEACSHYLHKPLVPNLIQTENVMKYIQSIEGFDYSVDRLLSFGPVRQMRVKIAEATIQNIVPVQTIGAALEAAIMNAMARLGPLAAL